MAETEVDTKEAEGEDPSIEDILESIRQIISDEDEAWSHKEGDENQDVGESADLDLTEKAGDVEDSSDLVLGGDKGLDVEATSDLTLKGETNAEDSSDLTLKGEVNAEDSSDLTLKGDAHESVSSDLNLSQAEQVASDGPDNDGILDLTDVVEEEKDVAPEENEEEKLSVDDIDGMFDEPVEDVPDIGLDDVEDEVVEVEEVVEEEKLQEVSPAEAAEIMSEDTEVAATEEMAKLASNMLMQRDDPERVLPVGKITLEDIVRELLNPMLKNWLDDNLPALIEKLVRRELEKISKQAQKDD